MEKLIIDRAKWRTGGADWGSEDPIIQDSVSPVWGTGKGDTFLNNSSGYMCCLGFYCNQAGIYKKDLLGLGSPIDFITIWDRIKHKVTPNSDLEVLLRFNVDGDPVGDSDFTDEAVEINDNPNIKPRDREKMIKEHFESLGIKVVFKGSYPKKSKK